MHDRKQKLIAVVVGLWFFLLAAILLCPWPSCVDISATAVEWQNNAAETEGSREVVINGVYKRRVIGSDTFSGRCYIEGLSERLGSSEIFLRFNNEEPYSVIYSISPENGNMLHEIAGGIVCSRGLREFSIFLNEDIDSMNWRARDSVVLTYPARDREQAAEQTAKLCENTWLSTVLWN